MRMANVDAGRWVGLGTVATRIVLKDVMHSRRGLWDQNSSLSPSRASAVARNTTSREEIRLPSILASSPIDSRMATSSSGPPLLEQSQTTKIQGDTFFISSASKPVKEGLWEKMVHEDNRVTKTVADSKRRARNEKLLARETVDHTRRARLPPIKGGDFNPPLSDKQCEYSLVKPGHSVVRHQNQCPRNHSPQPEMSPNRAVAVRGNVVAVQGNVVARVVTLGLVPGQCEQVFIREDISNRPKTRTLSHSSLHHTGHGLPSTDSKIGDMAPNLQQCRSCKRIIASDKLAVHQRMCQRDSAHVSTRTVALPSTLNHLRVEHARGPHPQACAQGALRKPPVVECFICGREYGSKSIAIHEPQCLKKFNEQNDKLPIKERLPLPKRKKVVSMACELSKEELQPVLPARCGLGVACVRVEPQENMVQRFFEHCYSEFERDLVPCKRCGRTFAPERHLKHEANCNAKPLKLL